MYKKIRILFFLTIVAFNVNAQEAIDLSGGSDIDFSKPKEYKIGGVVIEGAPHLDQGVLVLLSGFEMGEKVMVPGDKFSTAISNLWKQGLFEDVKITGKVLGETIFEETLTKSKTIINLNNAPSGIYFYQLKNQMEIIGSGKIILH